MEHPKAAIFIGNPIFGDDGIGIVLGQALEGRLRDAGYDVFVLERTGFTLLDYLEGYEEAVVVDSFCDEAGLPGQVVRFTIDKFRSVKSMAPHFSGIPEAVTLMRAIGMKVPRVTVVGVSVRDPYSLADHLSSDLAALEGSISERVLSEILGQCEAEVSA